MAMRGQYVKKMEPIADFYAEERLKAERHRMTAPNVFTAPKKCPSCGGSLTLVRKFDCFEDTVCKKCKRRYRRNVFRDVNEMEELFYGTEGNR